MRSSVQPAVLQLQSEEAAALERAGHDEMVRLVREEAEALVIFRIADQQHRAVAAALRLGDRRAHQRTADALALMVAIDGERAEQQGRHGIAVGIHARLDIPQAHGADDMAVRIAGDEREALGRHAAAADLFRRLLEAGLAHDAVEQTLARHDVAGIFPVDRESGMREERADRIKNSGHLWASRAQNRFKRYPERIVGLALPQGRERRVVR